MIDELLKKPVAPEVIAQSLYLALWLHSRGRVHPVALADHVEKEVKSILAWEPEYQPAPLRQALARCDSAHSPPVDLDIGRQAVVDAFNRGTRKRRAPEPDLIDPAELAMLRGKADAADALLAALGTEETAVAVERIDTLRKAAETLRAVDGILAPVPKLPAADPPVVARACYAAKVIPELEHEADKIRVNRDALWNRIVAIRSALGCDGADDVVEHAKAMRQQRDEAEERARSALGLREDTMRVAGAALTRIADAVHLNGGTASEVADAAVARIEALERDCGVLRAELARAAARSFDPCGTCQRERDEWRSALRGLCEDIDEHGLPPQETAERVRARARRDTSILARLREILEVSMGQTDADLPAAAQRCITEVHNLKARLDEQQREVAAAAGVLDEVRAALGTPEVADVVSHAKSIRAELEQSRAQDEDIEALASVLGLPEGAAVKQMIESVEQRAKGHAEFIGNIRAALGTPVGHDPLTHALTLVAELGWLRDLWGRTVGEKPQLNARILGSRYRMVDPHALKIAAEGRGLPVTAFAKPRTADEPGFWTAWLDELGAEFHRLDSSLRVAQDQAARCPKECARLWGEQTAELERLRTEAAKVPAIASERDGAFAAARDALGELRAIGEALSGLVDQPPADGCTPLVALARKIADRVRWLRARTPESAEASPDLSRLRTALAEIPTLTPQQMVDAAAAEIVEQRQRVATMRHALACLQHDNEAAATMLQNAGLKPAEHAGCEPPLVSLARRAVERLAWRDALKAELDSERQRRSDLTVKLEGAEAAATEARGYVTQIREALDLPPGADVLDCIKRAGNIRKRRELKAELDRVRADFDACARAAGVPWHNLKAWILGSASISKSDEQELERLADAERLATSVAARWRSAMQRLAAFLGVEHTGGTPEDIEDMCKGAVRAQSLQRGNGMTA